MGGKRASDDTRRPPAQGAAKPPNKPRALPNAVLFACTLNTVRSVMAAAILRHLAGDRTHVRSAGVHAGEPDPFLPTVMGEIGIDVTQHHPATLAELDDTSFDLIVTLSPEAHREALKLTRALAIEVEDWPTADVTTLLEEGSREQILERYRRVRDELLAKIRTRFGFEKNPTAR
jgi:protein-tyrosine-phosphatase